MVPHDPSAAEFKDVPIELYKVFIAQARLDLVKLHETFARAAPMPFATKTRRPSRC